MDQPLDGVGDDPERGAQGEQAVGAAPPGVGATLGEHEEAQRQQGVEGDDQEVGGERNAGEAAVEYVGKDEEVGDQRPDEEQRAQRGEGVGNVLAAPAGLQVGPLIDGEEAGEVGEQEERIDRRLDPEVGVAVGGDGERVESRADEPEREAGGEKAPETALLDVARAAQPGKHGHHGHEQQRRLAPVLGEALHLPGVENRERVEHHVARDDQQPDEGDTIAQQPGNQRGSAEIHLCAITSWRNVVPGKRDGKAGFLKLLKRRGI